MKFFFLFLIGVSLGSFLNVLIFRYQPSKKFNFFEIVKGRSFCPYCRKKILKKDLIPVLSFFLLRGRCRFCKRKISFVYPLVELISGILIVLVFIKSSLAGKFFWEPVFWSAIFLDFLVLSFMDLKHLFVPDALLNFGFLIGLIIVLFFPQNFHYFWRAFPSFSLRVLNHFLGMVIFGLPFYLFCKETQEKYFGFGDAKMIALVGFLFGWPKAMLEVSLAFLIGGFFSLLSLIFLKKNLKSKLPFLPFLALASVLGFFLENQIINLYLSLF